MEFFMKHKCQLAPICQQSLKATLFLFTKKPGMCQSCCFKVGCHPLFFNRIHVKPLKLCSKSRRSNRHIPQKINKFASLVLAERYPYFNGVIGLHIWRDLIYSEMSVLLELPAFTSYRSVRMYTATESFEISAAEKCGKCGKCGK